MANYLLFNKEPKEDKKKDIVKDSQQAYRDKKQTSLQNLIEDEGEAALPQSNANIIKMPKPTITAEDRERIPVLKEVKKLTDTIEAKIKGKKYEIKEGYRMRKLMIGIKHDMHYIKESYLRPISFKITKRESKVTIFFDDGGTFDEFGNYQPLPGLTFSKPQDVLNLLKNYSSLKESSWFDPDADIKYILDSLDDLITKAALPAHLEFILIQRIDGQGYNEISQAIKNEMGLNISVPRMSQYFTKKIPSLISEAFLRDYEDFYYLNKEKGNYKQCSKCGKVKLALPAYFRKQKNRKYGVATICKECRDQEDRARRGK